MSVPKIKKLKLIYINDGNWSNKFHDTGASHLEDFDLALKKYVPIFSEMLRDMGVVLPPGSDVSNGIHLATRSVDYVTKSIISLVTLTIKTDVDINQTDVPIFYSFTKKGKPPYEGADGVDFDMITDELNSNYFEEVLGYDIDFAPEVNEVVNAPFEYLLYPLSGVVIFDTIMDRYVIPSTKPWSN